MGVGLSFTNKFKELNYENVNKINRPYPELRKFQGRIGYGYDYDEPVFGNGLQLQIGFYFTNIMLPRGVKHEFSQIYVSQDVPCYPSFNYRFFFMPCLYAGHILEENYLYVFENVTYRHLEGVECSTKEKLLNSEYEFDFKKAVDRLSCAGYKIFNNDYPDKFTTKEPWNDWYQVINILDKIFKSKYGVYINSKRLKDLDLI